jgi:hypothetical protein
VLIVHKHPDTAVPTGTPEGHRVCDDEAVRPGVVYMVDPARYWLWQDGVEWTFGEMPDGTIVHVPWDQCDVPEPAIT